MLSWKSSANVKIIGAEGHSPEMLRSEVARGAKFVLYSYNFSLVVMSFKRPSNIYFVAPGQSRIVKGLPFTLISLVFGWWGIPWGIIYTFQSLATNLSGGEDVTDSILAALAPTPSAETTSATGPAAPPRSPAPAAPKPAFTPRRYLPVAGVVSALVAIVYICICLLYGQNLKVALVSGLPKPYTIELNGKPYQLTAANPTVLTLAQGKFVLRGAPGNKAEQSFIARTDFFARPFTPRVLVINPDRVALVYWQSINYHREGITPDPKEEGLLLLHANQTSYFLPEPDYFFAEFPQSITMPSNSSTTAKSRLTVAKDIPLQTRTSLISEKLGYPALRDHLRQLARLEPENELLQRLMVSLLKPDDARTIFESRLAERPVLVEWHRAYEFLMDGHFPGIDLAPRYRALAEADPENGALLYLYARLLLDPDTSRPFYEKALHAKTPCAYAAYALGTDAFGSGDYAASLRLFETAERMGLHSDALELRKRDTLLALDRAADALADIRQARTKDMTDTALFAEELMLSQSQVPDRVAGQRAIATFVSSLRARFGGNGYEIMDNYLAARLAYALGEELEAGNLLAKVDGPLNQFESAIDRRDFGNAVKALAKTPEIPTRYYWILMLAAHAKGDTAAADVFFNKAVASLEKSDRYSRQIAKAIGAATAADHAEILRTPSFADDLRIMFTALGIHFPAQRERYFARAGELDHDAAFPHLLLKTVRQKSEQPTQ